ncbi:(R)-mandelonitrile lyase [Brevundimonas sp.]|uniref:(R)-mandelonitrile lyase n=1 Tax=Brevundimonas sp. TaxID=1871086 RepID=UPI003D0FE202
MIASIFSATAALFGGETLNQTQEGAPVMEITRKVDQTTIDGPAEWFTGRVTISGQFQREAPSRVGGAVVHFEPGARTAWHLHPLGQTLIVTEGVGWTQIEGGPKLEFHAGDILWCPPEHKHWHGAMPHAAMTHIAIQESQNGSPVTWLEQVTDEQYLADTSAAVTEAE